MTHLLLDTHAFLWWLGEPTRLSPQARSAIADASAAVWVSAASIWEIEIKRRLGKLAAPADLIAEARREDFAILPITAEHAVAAADLPTLHGDPFDRMLVGQAILEGLAIVTRDERIAAYGARVLPT